MKITNTFCKLAEDNSQIVVVSGGSGSSKTYSILQILILKALKQTKATTMSIVSETLPQLKKGALIDFTNILKEEGIYSKILHNKTDNSFILGNTRIEFFSTDVMENILGARRDYLFINEAIRLNYDTAYTLMRYSKQSYIDFNPCYEFWAHTQLRQMPQCGWHDFTFIDNDFYPEHEKILLLERAKKDENFRRIFVEGKLGNIEGLIFPNIILMDMLPVEQDYYYGLDFGYKHPAALIKCVSIDGNPHFDEQIYQSYLTTQLLIELMKEKNINKKKKMFADSSRPDLIAEIKLAGYNIKPASKDVKAGIDLMKSRNIYITKESVNLIKEFRNYRYKESGAIIDEPLKIMDDGIDACRYAFYSREKMATKRIISIDVM